MTGCEVTTDFYQIQRKKPRTEKERNFLQHVAGNAVGKLKAANESGVKAELV
jgi:hypothetical protein